MYTGMCVTMVVFTMSLITRECFVFQSIYKLPGDWQRIARFKDLVVAKGAFVGGNIVL